MISKIRKLAKVFSREMYYVDFDGDFFTLSIEGRGNEARRELARTLRRIRKSKDMWEAVAHCRIYFYTEYADTCLVCGRHYIKEFEEMIAKRLIGCDL